MRTFDRRSCLAQRMKAGAGVQKKKTRDKKKKKKKVICEKRIEVSFLLLGAPLLGQDVLKCTLRFSCCCLPAVETHLG